MPGGLMLYWVSNGQKKSMWREHVLRALSRPIEEPGAWLVYDKCNPDFIKHVTSWGKIIEKNKKTKAEKEVWMRLKKDDHGLDCAIYAAALGDVLGAKHLKADPVKKPKYGVIGRAF
jgi:hypothetical protein